MKHTPRFYWEGPLTAGERLTVTQAIAHHLYHVLRKKSGDPVVFFNGEGWDHPGIIQSDQRVQLLDPVPNTREPSAPWIWIQAWSKPETMDTVVEKITEMGVHTLIPVHTAHSSHAASRQDPTKRYTRWETISRHAAQQCGRARLLTLAPPMAWDAALAAYAHLPNRWICTPTAGLHCLLPPIYPGSVVICAGPEGGFSESECAAALAVGFLPLSLGPRILRVETAAVSALAICQAAWDHG